MLHIACRALLKACKTFRVPLDDVHRAMRLRGTCICASDVQFAPRILAAHDRGTGDTAARPCGLGQSSLIGGISCKSYSTFRAQRSAADTEESTPPSLCHCNTPIAVSVRVECSAEPCHESDRHSLDTLTQLLFQDSREARNVD